MDRWSVAVLVLVYHMILSVHGDLAQAHASRSKMFLVIYFVVLSVSTVDLSVHVLKMLSAPYIAQGAFSIAALCVCYLFLFVHKVGI